MHLCDPGQAPTGIQTQVLSMRGGRLTNWAIPPTSRGTIVIVVADKTLQGMESQCHFILFLLVSLNH